MTRESVVTRERVWRAADALKARGIQKPSANQVREELQKGVAPGERIGAQDRIHAYVLEWRVQQNEPVPDAPAEDVSPALLMALRTEIRGAAQRAKNEWDAERDALLLDMVDLTNRTECQASQIFNLDEQLHQRTTERDAAQGALNQCRNELGRTAAALRSATEEQQATARQLVEAESSRASLARAAESLKQDLERAHVAVEKLLAELDSVNCARRSALERAAAAEAVVATLQDQASVATWPAAGRRRPVSPSYSVSPFKSLAGAARRSRAG